MKKKTFFACASCGYNSAKWLGKCPSCGEFNSFSEETEEKEPLKERSHRRFDAGAVSALKDVGSIERDRIKTGIGEVDRVFGGGIVKGSLVLLGGEPGAGKSTLALTIADRAAKAGIKGLYVSGEESLEQIKMRADRIGADSEKLYVVTETGVEKIAALMESEKPGLVIIDSIQTVYKEDIDSAAGGVNQVRESCAHLMYAAKKSGIPVLIVGHVTKDGSIAGPKTLEHMVDAVMYFESENYYRFKILRAVKNRFGSTNEIGVFEMGSAGITEVMSPSKMLLENIKEQKTGSAIVTVLEGTRPMLLEIQALTARRNFGMPQRTVTGIDYNRVLLIIAILEKMMDLSMENQDVFMNVAGGIKVFETAADLGIAAAVYSSFRSVPLPTKWAFIGELGLDGEVRPVHMMEERVAEATRMGFAKCIIPKRSGVKTKGMEVTEIGSVEELRKIMDF